MTAGVDGNDFEAWRQLAQIFTEQNKYSEAVNAYEHAVRIRSEVGRRLTTWPLQLPLPDEQKK